MSEGEPVPVPLFYERQDDGLVVPGEGIAEKPKQWYYHGHQTTNMELCLFAIIILAESALLGPRSVRPNFYCCHDLFMWSLSPRGCE